MQWLPKTVLDDIWEEEFVALYKGKQTTLLNMQQFKKQVQLRCKAVLNHMVVDNQ